MSSELPRDEVEQTYADTALDVFGEAWERMEHIFHTDWKTIFPEGKAELTPNQYYVRIALFGGLPYGTSVWAHEHIFNPALEIGVRCGAIETDLDDNGDPVIRLPDGEVGHGA